MIPDNVLSSRVLSTRFIFPDGVINNAPNEDYEMGGIALQDPSRGLEYQPWYGRWVSSDSTVYLYPNITGEGIPIFTEPDVFEFSFAFDQNMRYCTGVLKRDGVFQLRWYDTSVENYVVTTLPGIEAFKLTMDDKREVSVQQGWSDIILTYIRENTLYFRAQRERYGVEHVLQTELPNNLMIANFGMNQRYRLQWRLRYRNPGEYLPWLP